MRGRREGREGRGDGRGGGKLLGQVGNDNLSNFSKCANRKMMSADVVWQRQRLVCRDHSDEKDHSHPDTDAPSLMP